MACFSVGGVRVGGSGDPKQGSKEEVSLVESVVNLLSLSIPFKDTFIYM